MKVKTSDGREFEIDSISSVTLSDDEYLFIKLPEKHEKYAHYWIDEMFGDRAVRVITHSDDIEFAKVRFQSENKTTK